MNFSWESSVFGVVMVLVGWFLAKMDARRTSQLSYYRDLLARRLLDKRMQESSTLHITETEIGKRFASFLKGYLDSSRFWIDSFCLGGAYEVNMGERSENSFLTIRISLRDPEDSPIHIRFRWPDEKWDSGMDEKSILESFARLHKVLLSRYPYLFD